MILYYLDHSPFAARVRIAILAKGLDVTLAPPPGGALSAAYRARSPIGLVPSLELDDGTVIAESQIILEYLEDAFPEPSLRPATAEDRAQARILSHIVDLYLAEPLKRLFERSKNKKAPDRADNDLALSAVDGLVADRRAAHAALDHLDHYIGGRDQAIYAIGEHLTTADCALASILFFVDRASALFGDRGPFQDRPHLGAYWSEIASDASVAAVLKDMTTAQTRRAQQRADGVPED